MKSSSTRPVTPAAPGDKRHLGLIWRARISLDRLREVVSIAAQLSRKALRIPRHLLQLARKQGLDKSLEKGAMVAFRPRRPDSVRQLMEAPIRPVHSVPHIFGQPGWYQKRRWPLDQPPVARVVELKNVYLTNLGRIFDSQGRALFEYWHRPPFLLKHWAGLAFCGAEAHLVLFDGEIPEVDEIWMLEQQNSRIYGHFLIEVLPRLVLSRRTGLGADDHIYLRETHPNHEEALGLLGVNKRRRIDSNRQPVIFARRAIVPVYTHFRGMVAGALLAETASRLKAAVHDLEAGRRVSRIHLSRDHMPNKNVVNAGEVDAALDGAGFEKIFPEAMSFSAQVRAFHNADFVVGIHCSGMLNGMFCKPGTALVDYSAANIDNRLHDILSATGIRHVTVQCPAGSTAHYTRSRSLAVPVEWLRAGLACAGIEAER